MNLSFEPGRCFLIAEVAQAHDGSLGTAHAFIDAVAASGADAVKFQTHIASAESTPAEPWRVKFSFQDETRYDYWKRMEFTEEQWAGLAAHARDKGLHFLSSPFSIEAVELLERIGVPAWKVASGEVTNVPMLDRLLESRLPVILSSGMSSIADLDEAVQRVQRADVPLAVLQCTTEYPCPPQRVGLNILSMLRERYGCPVGLSDHSGTIYPCLAAAALGAEVLEVHVTLSREMFGPDVPASLTTGDLRQLVEGLHFIEQMLAAPVDKDRMAEEKAEIRNLFSKSIVARRDIEAGTRLGHEHLTVKKPGTGIPARRLDELVGRVSSRPIPADTLLTEDDIV